MKQLSISFTLSKASQQHGANVEHNNRDFIARNIDPSRVHENVTYVRQEVHEAYSELFGKAIEEYNNKQKRSDRKISDYYEHIANGRREEAFYEIVVQFGDVNTAACKSETGQITKQMLDEYIRSFRKRNPNLYIFNAVLHMDEATPHLHIDFIPFYTQARKNSLSKGVSMRAALDEQGFGATTFKQNRLVEWEESERTYMEQLLNKYGFTREDKNAKYAHQTVDEFKKAKDEKKMISAIRKVKNVSDAELSAEHIRQLKTKLLSLERKTETLEKEKQSPYKSFYYSSPDKQSFVQTKLDELKIPYRETENGFEAQECYIEQIRNIEKEYKTPRSSAREILRQDIDRLLMQSRTFDELLEKLKKENYTVKTGKYISVKPAHGGQAIRLKSLGEFYSEYALRNRINAKLKYESELAKKLNSEKANRPADAPQVMILRTIQMYTITFSRGLLPMKKRNPQKPFAWNNDSELDRLMELNRKINSGATLETFRKEFADAEKTVSEKEKQIEKSKSALKSFYDLQEQIQIVFEGKKSEIFSPEQARQALQAYPNITKENYHNIETLIESETETLRKEESDYQTEKEKLEKADELLSMAEKVIGGTYIQTLAAEERHRRESDYLPNGLKQA
ncbi:MAG: plasmid recombination protein [Oscillospiraceae bacterium]|nr:plasmid recombination protein [Oscillospiraceae bacterium]